MLGWSDGPTPDSSAYHNASPLVSCHQPVELIVSTTFTIFQQNVLGRYEKNNVFLIARLASGHYSYMREKWCNCTIFLIHFYQPRSG